MTENTERNLCQRDYIDETYLVSVYNGKKYSVHSNKRFNIGRKIDHYNNADLCIDEGIISRSHATIVQENKKYYLIDLNSKNGTCLNGKKLLPNQKYLLNNYDILEFSRIKYKFESSTIKEEKHHFDFGSVEFLNVYGKKRLCIELGKNKEVIFYQYEMVHSNSINGLLDMTMMDSEGCCRIYYDIDKMESFSSFIHQKGCLSKSEFLQILLDIFEVLKKAQDYLLNPNALLLMPGLIFITKDENKPNMIYLPFDISVQEDTYLKNFISTLASSFLEESEKDFQVRMLKAISNESFNISDFKSIILDEQELCLPFEIEDLHIEKKVPESRIKKYIKNAKGYDKKRQLFIILQAVLILTMGSILIQGILKMHQYVGLLIIVGAIDVGFIHKYYHKLLKKEEKSNAKRQHPKQEI